MEFKISDLLDDLQEVNVDILPYTSASEDRIKELTMEKIQKHGKYEGKRRGMGFVGKLLIAAALIAALALPVMAAGGFRFSDWLDGMLDKKPHWKYEDFDNSLLYGGGSTTWETSNWLITTSAEDAQATGLTFVCDEWGNEEALGTLAASEGYWLEKWDGSGYVPMEGKYESENSLPVEDNAVTQWAIHWESVYGTLESGSYRLGKIFTYTNPDGETEETTRYVKFRIFTEEMDPYITQYETAFEALYAQESYHMTYITYDDHDEDYEYYVKEIWKSGDDYLMDRRYIHEDGSVMKRYGAMLRNGVGYSLQWSGDSVTSQVAQWENADYMAPDNFDSWHTWLAFIDSLVGEMYVDGNTLRFYEYHDFIDETGMTQEEMDALTKEYITWNHDYQEYAYTFDESGNITAMTVTAMLSLDPETADPFVKRSVEIHNTDPREIAKVIQAQNVSGVNTFSWTDDQETYAEAAITGGFRNTDQAPIDSAQDAIARAKKEAVVTENPKYREDYDYNMNQAWYDESAGMWKVQFQNSQDDDFWFLVYLDTDGVTRMTVYP